MAVLTLSFRAEHSEKHDVDGAVFPVDGLRSLQDACHRYGYDFGYEKHRIGTLPNVYSEKENAEVYVSRTVSVTPKQKQLKWPRSFSFGWNQLI